MPDALSDALSNSQHHNDREHLLHPFTEFPRFLNEGSRFFERAEGAYVFGADGKRYLDGVGGLWCVNIGYGRREMADAIAEQAMKLPYYNTFGDMSSGPAADLAAKLAELAPGALNHVFFTTGGSTSIDTAVRIAHYVFQAEGRPQKQKILAREMGYHGSTFLAASITGIRRNHAGFHVLSAGDDPLVNYVACPNAYRPSAELGGEQNEAAHVEWLIADLEAAIARIGADNIAVFLAEPIMGAGGVIVAPKGYHARALEVCRRNDILYVSDEVVTAFGRLGHMFASEEAFAIEPDMIACAKGITSAYVPLGAVLFSDRIHRAISQPKSGSAVFSHGFTYSGHPVACAAGLKNIEIMEREDLCGHVCKLAPRLRAKLSELSELPVVGDVRGEGFMMAIELVADKAAKRNFEPGVAAAKKVAAAAYARGLIVRATADAVLLSPPLVLSEQQIDWLAETLRASILEAGLTV